MVRLNNDGSMDYTFGLKGVMIDFEVLTIEIVATSLLVVFRSVGSVCAIEELGAHVRGHHDTSFLDHSSGNPRSIDLRRRYAARGQGVVASV